MSAVVVARAAAPRARLLLGAAALGAGSDLAAVALTACAVWLITRAAQQPPIAALGVAVVGVRAFALARGALRYAERLVGHDAALAAVARLRERAYRVLATAPDATLNATLNAAPDATPGATSNATPNTAPGAGLRHADVQARLVSDVDAVQDVLLRCLLPAVSAVAVAVAAVWFCGALLPVAGVAFAVGVALAGVAVPGLAAVAVARADRKLAAARIEWATRSLDLLAGAPDLVAAGADGVAADRARAAAKGVRRWERAGSVAGWSALALAVQGTTAVVVAALATAGVARGQLDAVWPPVLALVALAAFEPVKPLVTAARQAVAGRGSLHRLAALLSTPPEPLTAHERPVSTTRPAPPNEATPPAGARVAVPGEAAPPNQATRPAGARVAGQSEAPNAAEAASERVVPTTGTWEVRDVVVRYRADGPAALAGVSVTLAPGRAVAVVGVSGSGKSTLLGVLARLVPVRAGRVLLAGVDVLATPADLVRERVTGVLPDAHVFAASLRANLLLAAPDADDDRLLAALRAAGLDEPPGGWDAVPGEDGARLSGGQRQRVLLARALLADRPLVLLDEPTEGLDPAMADEVLARVRAACRGRALCVVTHRLAPLAGFDEVVVLDAGRVVQRGTHAELVARPGRYRDLWEAERLANP